MHSVILVKMIAKALIVLKKVNQCGQTGYALGKNYREQIVTHIKQTEFLTWFILKLSTVDVLL